MGKQEWTPDLTSAIKLIKRLCSELPQSLVTEKAQEMGKIRKKEMEGFLKSLADETSQFELI